MGVAGPTADLDLAAFLIEDSGRDTSSTRRHLL